MAFRFPIAAICQDIRALATMRAARRGGMSSRNPLSEGAAHERPAIARCRSA